MCYIIYMLPKNFRQAISKIKKLRIYNRYTGAFIFGSAARNEVVKDSDLDIIITTKEEAICNNVSHPFIDGVKSDISFISIEQLISQTKKQENNGRIPMIAESIILFDKTGELNKLKKSYRKIKSLKYLKKDYPQRQFLIYHINNKVERNLLNDPYSSLLAMHLDLNDLLGIHYHIHGKWWLGSKRIMSDLDRWDKSLALLLRKFISANGIQTKFSVWSKIINHISKPMGKKQKIEDIKCACKTCKIDLENLMSGR